MGRLIPVVLLWTTVPLGAAFASGPLEELQLEIAMEELGRAMDQAALYASFEPDLTSYASDRPLAELPEAQALQAASKTLTFDGMTIVFNARVSLNSHFNPLDVDREYKGARVHGSMSVTKKSMGRVALPHGVVINRLFVVSEDRVWLTKVENQGTGGVGYYTVFGVDELPKWKPGTRVDVFAELLMPGGPPVYLAVRGLEVIEAS